MSPGTLALGTRLLGEGQPCLVAAHVGHAHEGRVDDALRLIEAAFQAGADAIVFSIFRTDELLVRRHPLTLFAHLSAGLVCARDLPRPALFLLRVAAIAARRRPHRAGGRRYDRGPRWLTSRKCVPRPDSSR